MFVINNKEWFISVARGNISKLDHFLYYDINFLNIRDSKGRTALIRACIQGRLNTARFLIDRGADIFAQDFDGKDALYYSITNNNLSISEYIDKVVKKWY